MGRDKSAWVVSMDLERSAWSRCGEMELSETNIRPKSEERGSVAVRIESLAARVQDLLDQKVEAAATVETQQVVGAASVAGEGASTHAPIDVNGTADSALTDQISYLQSALTQRSVEAEEWMSADRAARQLLDASKAALITTKAALAREREAKSLAEKDAARLKEELEFLTRLLLEVEAREASKVEAAKADAAARHEEQVAQLKARISDLLDEVEAGNRAQDAFEKGSAEERVRTDQYRDVAQKMQALCVHQAGELTLMREQAREAASQSERQQQDLNRLADNYRKIRQTTSWRATAPIRKLFRAFKPKS